MQSSLVVESVPTAAARKSEKFNLAELSYFKYKDKRKSVESIIIFRKYNSFRKQKFSSKVFYYL